MMEKVEVFCKNKRFTVASQGVAFVDLTDLEKEQEYVIFLDPQMSVAEAGEKIEKIISLLLALEKVQFRNLTPHFIGIYAEDGKTHLMNIPAEPLSVRVKEQDQVCASIGGISVVKKRYTEVENLPEPQEGVVLIVSDVVLQALNGSRSDVVCPDTGPDSVVRNEEGQILGVRRFQVLRKKLREGIQYPQHEVPMSLPELRLSGLL